VVASDFSSVGFEAGPLDLAAEEVDAEHLQAM
jgi:hypothetical protein